jgi:hypothetical protein
LKASSWQHLPFRVGLSIVTKQKKPALWKVMRDAYDNAAEFVRGEEDGDLIDRTGYAAELRAIADEVVPEEPVLNKDRYSTEDYWIYVQAQWEQRTATRARLLKAAAEAEGSP